MYDVSSHQAGSDMMVVLSYILMVLILGSSLS